MSRPPIFSEHLTPTLTLTQCHDGFWLYDITRGMNLAMCEPSKEAALFNALKYYQRRLEQVEYDHTLLARKVEAMLEIFRPEDDEE